MIDTEKRTVYIQYYDSPCGELVLASIEDKLCLCDWTNMPKTSSNKLRIERRLNAVFEEKASDVITRARIQLNEYFCGKRTKFDIPLHLAGTAFQERVWLALQEIPYGQTCTYKDIALKVGCTKGVRAVAQAIGANGISIILPCHRVIGADHSLTGYAGGLAAKQKLLRLEVRNSEGYL